MNNNELMIGDIIAIKENYTNGKVVTEQLKPVKVLEIQQNLLRIDLLDGRQAYINYNQVFPLPITLNILDQNGFASEDSGYVYDNYDGTIIIVNLWDHEFKIIDGYEVAVKIKSYNMAVHELQHALNLCEIKKTIQV